ncbi:MAG: hypothetical protein ACI9KN_001270 [Gammaproteobacteria bacterium]|jgi:hypothetical protein
MINVSCLCGDIQFKVKGDLTDVSFCHCSICRKAGGSAFAAYGSTRINNIEWLSGENNLRRYTVSELLTKLFCQQCGATLITHHAEEPDLYHISLGNIQGSAELRPSYHQFVGSKANWYAITDDLQQYLAWPDE